MKKNIKGITVVSLVAVLASSMVACNPGATPNNTNRTQGYQANGNRANNVAPYHDGVRPYGVRNDGVRPYGTPSPVNNDGHNTTTDNHAVAARIAQVAGTVPGVAHVTTVVVGNDAIVGLDLTNTAKDNRQRIEQQVRRTVQAADPGYNVHVTADGALRQRIRTLSTQLGNGHPIRTLANDVGTLIRDIGRTVTAPFR